MALIGYARVSSVGQSLDVQLDKLSHCEKIFEEKKSGASVKRPRLEACLEYVRAGDTLVITRLSSCFLAKPVCKHPPLLSSPRCYALLPCFLLLISK